MYLPANTTSLIQPCDQGIIRTMKAYYRKEMRQRIIDNIDCKQDAEANNIAKKTTLLEAIHLLNKAWDSVSSKTIKNCFKKGGFIPKDENSITDEIITEDAEVPPACMSENEFNDWVNIDQDVPTSQQLTEDELCDNNNITQDESVDDDDVSADVKIPTNKELLNALDILRVGVQYYGESFNEQYVYEKFIHQIIEKNKVQKKLMIILLKNRI